jgi:spore maturation protein CgeB
VGHCEPHYINYLRYLKELKALILIRGDDWLSKKKLFNNNWLIAGSVWEEDYAKVLRSSKISLGFLSRYSKKIPDFHTSRSVEIPACGSFLLAERTHEHMVLFEEGKEADFFNEGEELIDKAKFYLKNENVRNKIAKAGYEKVYKLGLRNDDVMKKVLDKLIFI